MNVHVVIFKLGKISALAEHSSRENLHLGKTCLRLSTPSHQHTHCVSSLVNQTAFSARGLIACSISARAERVGNTSNTYFVSAPHPHPEVLIDARGSLNRNST